MATSCLVVLALVMPPCHGFVANPAIPTAARHAMTGPAPPVASVRLFRPRLVQPPAATVSSARHGDAVMQNAAQGPGTERRALRLIFAYEGSEIRLTDVLALDKATRPSDPIQEKGDRPRSGFWIELHGTGGRALYRQVMDNPVRFHAEVPDGKGGFTNRPIANPRGTFFVLVPDLADA
jgi:hypothetical protein